MNQVHDKQMGLQETMTLDGRKVTLKQLRKVIKNAIESLAFPVIATMGANGMYHIFQKETVFGHTAEITNDGVTVAKSLLPLQSKPQDIIASLILEAAQKTAFVAGDGTTRTIAMIYKMISMLLTDKSFSLSMKSLFRNINPYKVQEGIELAVDKALAHIDAYKRKVDLDDLWKIAYTSSHGNEKVADNIKSLYSQIDKKDWGINIDFEDGISYEDKVVKKTGYIITIKSPSVNVNIPPRIESPRIILFNAKLDDFGILAQNIHFRVMRDTSPVIFIVKELNHALIELSKEMEKTYRVPIYLVKVDTYGQEVDKQFEDICAMATAEMLEGFDEQGNVQYELSWRSNAILKDRLAGNIPKCNPESPSPFYELQIKSALLTGEECIFEFNTDKSVTDAYIELISEFESQDPVLIKNHASRLNRLKSVSCTYYVGGNSQTEIQTNKYLVEDALMACASAVKSGVLPGGAWFDIHCATYLEENKPTDSDVLLGYNAVIEALKYGLQIMCASGYQDYGKIYKNYKEGKHLFNFGNFKYESIETSNIYDSAASLSESLLNSMAVLNKFIKLNTLTY
jgi:chaperonin GroEL (HSP60 family)